MPLNMPLSSNFERANANVTGAEPGGGDLLGRGNLYRRRDGNDLGFPPIPSKAIASGNHTVTLKCPDGKGETRKVAVAPGEKVRVPFGPPKVSW